MSRSYRNVFRRAAFDAGLLVAAAVLPWYASVLIAAVGFFLFDSFFEGVLAAIFLELLFAPPPAGAGWSLRPLILLSFFMLAAVPYAKRRLAFYTTDAQIHF